MSTPQKNQPLRSAKQSLAVLANAFKQIGGCGLFAAYGAFLLVCCALFCILRPETFPVFGNAVWYSFQAITTIGFGDIVAIPSVALSRFSWGFLCIISALITGTVVNYYNEMMRLRKNDSIAAFDEQMRKLTELSPDELSELEQKYRDFTKGHRQ